jgi:hypothetical protein
LVWCADRLDDQLRGKWIRLATSKRGNETLVHPEASIKGKDILLPLAGLPIVENHVKRLTENTPKCG